MKTLLSVLLAVCFATCGFAQNEDQAKATQEYLERNKERMADQQLMQQIVQAIYNPKMHKELSLTTDQIEDLKPLMQEFQQSSMKVMTKYKDEIAEAQKLMAEGKSAEGMKLMEGIQEEVFSYTDKLIEKAESIILPHQLDRIRQISKQQTSKYANEFRDEFGVAFGLADELGLTDDEKKHLKATITKVRRDYYKKFKELKENANQEILESIPAEKRAKLKEIIGEQFDAGNGFGPVEPEEIKEVPAKKKFDDEHDN